MNRTWNELDSAIKPILAKVVLRLKGILERNGRVVKPYLFQMEDRRNSKEYAKHFERSEPVEEWDDRLKLYGVKIKPLYPAAVVTGRKKIRHQNLEDLMELI
ncbi:hypothetical protein GX48_05103 [Paracoccidioides brasiliensis]|nr:hypothetical protein GX48_05103 [Paracoccidioides brasiliensis]